MCCETGHTIFQSSLSEEIFDTRLNSQKLNISALLILNVFSCFLTSIAILTAGLAYIKVPDKSSCCDVTLFRPILTGRTQCFLSIFSIRLTCFSFLFFQMGFAAAAPFLFKSLSCPIGGITADLFRRRILSTKTVRRVYYSTGNVHCALQHRYA